MNMSSKQVWQLVTFILCIVISGLMLNQVGFFNDVRFFPDPSSPSHVLDPVAPNSPDIANQEPPASTYISVADLTSPTVKEEYGSTYSLKGNGITLHGSVSPNVTKIVVAYITGQEEHTLTRFTPGDESWEYNVRLYLGNLRRGSNEYEIRAYIDDKHQPVITRVGIIADIYRSEVMESVGEIEVEWHAPEKVETLEFLKPFELRQEGKDLVMNYESFFGESMTGMTLNQRLEALLVFNKVGDVTKGHYAGHKVYHVTVTQEGMCGGDPNNYHRILLGPDNSLIFLAQYSDSIDNRLYELLPFLVDKSVSMNLLPPDTIPVPGTQLSLRKKDSYNSFASFKDTEMLFEATGSPTAIHLDNNLNCYVTRHPDATFSTYLLDLPTRSLSAQQKEEMEKMGKFTRTGEGILDITWKNGAKNTVQYVSRDYFGGFDLGCSYMLVDVKDGKLLSTDEYIGGPLEQIGETSWGAPVYREVYGAAQLKAFSGSGIYGEQSHRLFRVYDQYYSEVKPSISDFYTQNHVIYIPDPFGHYMQFTDINVIPAAEKCKPVIYLYPEEETDISVEVVPRGGFSLTIPEYGDGWNVRATPEGVITNHEDNQEYPYLFWEGFGSPGYRMHDRGFVLRREEIACRLPILLHDLGLRGKEIDDFMEYWQPRLTQKPYYYITFMPQEEFEKEAPLSIEPKPDTVIRVFMDYEGLDAPIPVIQQQLSAPVRKGFTVIEWGGAKH